VQAFIEWAAWFAILCGHTIWVEDGGWGARQDGDMEHDGSGSARHIIQEARGYV